MAQYYTGIGSRTTPTSIKPRIEEICQEYAAKGYILRSGNADGADTFFYESHIKYSDQHEIYLPWPKFNKIQNTKFIPIDNIPSYILSEAELIASAVHPAWNNCSRGIKKLHMRNVFQVLGKDLQTPSKILFCWTEGGQIKGGTATAINLALREGIQVINLGKA